MPYLLVVNSLDGWKHDYHLFLYALASTVCNNTLYLESDTSMEFKVQEKNRQSLVMVVLGNQIVNNGKLDKLVEQLDEKYDVLEIRVYSYDYCEVNNPRYDLFDGWKTGPGQFMKYFLSTYVDTYLLNCDVFENIDVPIFNTGILEYSENRELYNVITEYDRMYMENTKKAADFWNLFHLEKNISLYDNYIKILSNQTSFQLQLINSKKLELIETKKLHKLEKQYLQSKFLRLAHKMVKKGIDLPDQLKLHYVVSEYQDRLGHVVHIKPFLNKSKALRKCPERTKGGSRKDDWFHKENAVVDSDTSVDLELYHTDNKKKYEADFRLNPFLCSGR